MSEEFTVKPLTPGTWDAFAALVERHNGIFGGCWCTWFHPHSPERGVSYEGNRDVKCRLVEQGVAHAALVLDGDRAVAWAEYGTPEELPTMKHRKDYEARGEPLPDFRVTCIFVDRDYRRRGLSHLALRGALDLIAEAGGGVVEGYPHDLSDGRRIGSSFLYGGTRALFESAGFSYEGPKGQGNTVTRRTLAPA